jgi:iron complex outermembrane receptor protein
MSVRVCACVAAAAACLAASSGVSAQSAAEPAELPEIVVTTPSPVQKPAKKATKAVSPAPAQQGPSPQPAAAPAPPAEPPLLPLPGGVVADEAFVPVTVTTARELEANAGATLTDTLMTKPGISGSTFAAGANRPIIRGLDNYRVRIQEDGIAVHDVSNLSEDHAIPIDPFSADQVEVVRGPATLRYGSQAIGGVVNATNDRIPAFVPPHGISAEITGGMTSADDGRDGAFQVTAGSDGLALHADGFKRRAEDYDTPDGVQFNSFVQSDGGALGGSLIGPDGFIGISYSRFASLYGIPGAEAEDERGRIDLAQDKILSKGEWRPKANGIEAIRYWFGWSDYAHNELDFNGTDFDVGSRFINRETEGRIEVQHQAVMTGLGELSGAAGVQFGHRHIAGESFEGDSLLEPARTEMVAGFLFEELQATRDLRLQAAVRYEQSDVSGTGREVALPAAPLINRDEIFGPKSASLGLLYDLPFDIVARASGQYVERAPDAAELFSKGAHDATATFEIGNPNLEKERARTAELGLKRATGAFRFDASVYYTDFGGFIVKELQSAFCGGTFDSCDSAVQDEDHPLHELVFEQKDATFYGAELLVEQDVAPVWNGIWGVTGQYDFVHAKFDDGEYVPRMPPHRLGGGVYYHDANWIARTSLLHAFRQDQIAPNETPTSGYTLLDAELSYTFAGEATHEGVTPVMTIGIKAENLLDDDVRNSASFKKDEVLLPGASVRLFGTVKLN